MYGSDSKKMKSKFFLAVLLLTPILVVTFSTLYFLMGMSPEGTKNNGVFFKSYFDLNNFKNGEGKQDLLKFDDGKSNFFMISCLCVFILAIISPIGSLKLIIFLSTS